MDIKYGIVLQRNPGAMYSIHQWLWAHVWSVLWFDWGDGIHSTIIWSWARRGCKEVMKKRERLSRRLLDPAQWVAGPSRDGEPVYGHAKWWGKHRLLKVMARNWGSNFWVSPLWCEHLINQEILDGQPRIFPEWTVPPCAPSETAFLVKST